MSETARCGVAIVGAEGERGPCDQPATGWRWYQDCEHEDMLDVACEVHANEGGRRIAAGEGLNLDPGCFHRLTRPASISDQRPLCIQCFQIVEDSK